MLSASDLDRITIDEDVLEIVPETVARNHTVLPLSWDDTSIHLVIPSDTPGRMAELLTTLRFILDRKLTFDVAERATLETIVDLHYSACGSMIRNCPRTFAFRCNQRWVDLERTGDLRLRHCDKCDTIVRLCKAGDELDAAVARGECVAYYDRSEDFLGIICDE